MTDWRKPCSHGHYGSHKQCTECQRLGGPGIDCPGGSPVTAADLEGLGTPLYWCLSHDRGAMAWVDGVPQYCSQGYARPPNECQFERRLLIPIPEAQPATEGT